jgi:hypothetical protein
MCGRLLINEINEKLPSKSFVFEKRFVFVVKIYIIFFLKIVCNSFPPPLSLSPITIIQCLEFQICY